MAQPFLPIYADTRPMDGHNKSINIFISAREDGKSSKWWMDKVYKPWKKTGQTCLYLVYNAVEISEEFLDSIQDNIINKFTDDNVKFEYSVSKFKSGIVDVKIQGKLFVRLLSLSIKTRRMKQSLLKDIGMIWMDEFIINPRKGEKYPKGTAFALEEIYSTYKRERIDKGKPLKMYFTGNPYSLYNPVFMWLKVPTNKLKLGQIITGENWCVHWHKLSDALIEKLKDDNPMLEIDEDYRKYAFDGIPVNDENIKLAPFPLNYHMRFIFKIDGQYIAVYQNKYYEEHCDKYYCCITNRDEISRNREIICFDFGELVNRCALLSPQDRNKFNTFKIAMRKRNVAFDTIECYYLVEEIYYNI